MSAFSSEVYQSRFICCSWKRNRSTCLSCVTYVIDPSRSDGWIYSSTPVLSTYNKPSGLPTQLLKTSANFSLHQLLLFPHKSTECITTARYELTMHKRKMTGISEELLFTWNIRTDKIYRHSHHYKIGIGCIDVKIGCKAVSEIMGLSCTLIDWYERKCCD